VVVPLAKLPETQAETRLTENDSQSKFGPMRKYLVLVPIMTLLGLSACGESPSTPSADGKVTIVTTTTQLTDFARVVGGEHVRVYGVLEANVDPHDYEPSPSDLQHIGAADVLVRSGLGIDGWFDDTIRSARPKGREVDASTGAQLRKGNGEDAEDDPHIWHDPRNAKIMVRNITQALEDADPGHAGDYLRHEAEYARQLDDLDAEVKAAIDTLANKGIVTNHDAFGYYIDRYGLTYVGSIIPSFDTQGELSAADIGDIVDRIRATGVKAVFSESSLPPKTAEVIGKEAGVKVVAGDDALYGDSLGPDGSDGDTYLGMIRHNTMVIVANLS